MVSVRARLYWTNDGQRGSGSSMGRSLVNGTQVNRQLTRARGPVGLAISGNYLYRSDPGVDNGSPGTTIGRARLDGTDVNANVNEGRNCPHRLVIKGGYIYWSSRRGNTIGRAPLNGADVKQNFITGALSPAGVVVGCGRGVRPWGGDPLIAVDLGAGVPTSRRT